MSPSVDQLRPCLHGKATGSSMNRLWSFWITSQMDETNKKTKCRFYKFATKTVTYLLYDCIPLLQFRRLDLAKIHLVTAEVSLLSPTRVVTFLKRKIEGLATLQGNAQSLDRKALDLGDVPNTLDLQCTQGTKPVFLGKISRKRYFYLPKKNGC